MKNNPNNFTISQSTLLTFNTSWLLYFIWDLFQKLDSISLIVSDHHMKWKKWTHAAVKSFSALAVLCKRKGGFLLNICLCTAITFCHNQSYLFFGCFWKGRQIWSWDRTFFHWFLSPILQHLYKSCIHRPCYYNDWIILELPELTGFRDNDDHFPTKAIHLGQKPEQWSSMAVIPPITLSSIFKQNAPGKNEG